MKEIINLTPEEYNISKKEHYINLHKGLYNINNSKDFPKDLLKKVYDKNDNVLFGSNMTKGKVYYQNIDKIFTKNNIPIIVNSGCTYDGIGNKDLPPDTEFTTYEELKLVFTENQFQ